MQPRKAIALTILMGRMTRAFKQDTDDLFREGPGRKEGRLWVPPVLSPMQHET